MKVLVNILLAINIIITLNISVSASEKPGESSKVFDTSQNYDEQEVYWFFVRVRIDKRKNNYQIVGTGSRIMIGSKKEFAKAIWWGISRRQIAIGPFYSEEEAENSKILYKRSKEKINDLPVVQPPEQIHWFNMTFKQLERIGAYQIERNPAAVASGSTEDFIGMLYEGITFEKLAIGPFWDYTQAEEAKAIYRENE